MPALPPQVVRFRTAPWYTLGTVSLCRALQVEHMCVYLYLICTYDPYSIGVVGSMVPTWCKLDQANEYKTCIFVSIAGSLAFLSLVCMLETEI